MYVTNDGSSGVNHCIAANTTSYWFKLFLDMPGFSLFIQIVHKYYTLSLKHHFAYLNTRGVAQQVDNLDSIKACSVIFLAALIMGLCYDLVLKIGVQS